MKDKSTKDIAGLLSQYQQSEAVSVEAMNESIRSYLQQWIAEPENRVLGKVSGSFQEKSVFGDDFLAERDNAPPQQREAF